MTHHNDDAVGRRGLMILLDLLEDGKPPVKLSEEFWASGERHRRVSDLLDAGLVRVVPEGQSFPQGICITDRGIAYINYITSLPLPEVDWVMPEAG